jgi:acetyl esterase/lipase
LKVHAASEKKNPDNTKFVLLDGRVVLSGNTVGNDGRIHHVKNSLLRLKRSKSKSSQGTILLLPGGGFEKLNFRNEGEKTARFLNGQNFDVAILEYHVGEGSQFRDSALNDAMNAYRFLRTNSNSLGLSDKSLIMMGFTSGAYLAARTVRKLHETEHNQPD